MAGGGWRLAVGSWQLAMGGGWWLVIGGWWRLAVVGGWRLIAFGGWRWLVVGGWWLVVGGWWRLAVGGPLGQSLRGVLNKKEIKINLVPKGPPRRHHHHNHPTTPTTTTTTEEVTQGSCDRGTWEQTKTATWLSDLTRRLCGLCALGGPAVRCDSRGWGKQQGGGQNNSVSLGPHPPCLTAMK